MPGVVRHCNDSQIDTPMPAFGVATAPMLDERTEIVSGRKAVGTYDVPDSDEAGEAARHSSC